MAAQISWASASASCLFSSRSRANSGCLSEKTKVAVSDGEKPCRARAAEDATGARGRAPRPGPDVVAAVLLERLREELDERWACSSISALSMPRARPGQLAPPVGEKRRLVLPKNRRQPALWVCHDAPLRWVTSVLGPWGREDSPIYPSRRPLRNRMGPGSSYRGGVREEEAPSPPRRGCPGVGPLDRDALSLGLAAPVPVLGDGLDEAGHELVDLAVSSDQHPILGRPRTGSAGRRLAVDAAG